MNITSVEGFLAYWQRIHQRSLRVVECIPEEHLEWSYRPGKWTLGDLVRHLAALERYMFAENVSGRPSLYRGCGEDLASGRGAVLELFTSLNRETVGLIGDLRDDQLTSPCLTPGGARLPIWKWLRAMVEHHVHHRGQIYFSLAQLDVKTPPLFGLSAEQVAERSRAD